MTAPAPAQPVAQEHQPAVAQVAAVDSLRAEAVQAARQVERQQGQAVDSQVVQVAAVVPAQVVAEQLPVLLVGPEAVLYEDVSQSARSVKSLNRCRHRHWVEFRFHAVTEAPLCVCAVALHCPTLRTRLTLTQLAW